MRFLQAERRPYLCRQALPWEEYEAPREAELFDFLEAGLFCLEMPPTGHPSGVRTPWGHCIDYMACVYAAAYEAVPPDWVVWHGKFYSMLELGYPEAELDEMCGAIERRWPHLCATWADERWEFIERARQGLLGRDV